MSPRNAPSVHRIVNRCVSIATLNMLSVHRIVNRCVSIETLNVLSGHRIVNSSVSIATPNVPWVHRIVNRCVSIATPNIPSVQRVIDRCVPAETYKKMTLVVNPRSTNWTLVLVLSCYSLLCMLPEEAKSSYQMADSGYDTYLRDAHRQVKKISTLSILRFVWRNQLKAVCTFRWATDASYFVFWWRPLRIQGQTQVFREVHFGTAGAMEPSVPCCLYCSSPRCVECGNPWSGPGSLWQTPRALWNPSTRAPFCAWSWTGCRGCSIRYVPVQYPMKCSLILRKKLNCHCEEMTLFIVAMVSCCRVTTWIYRWRQWCRVWRTSRTRTSTSSYWTSSFPPKMTSERCPTYSRRWGIPCANNWLPVVNFRILESL